MKQTLQLLISLNTGETFTFEDSFGEMIFSVDYKNDWEDTYLYDEFTNNLCNEIIKISSSTSDNSYQSYLDFNNFCKQHLLNVSKDNLTNIVIKDNFGNVYYNILKDQIYNLTVQSGNFLNEEKIFNCVLTIFLKGE